MAPTMLTSFLESCTSSPIRTGITGHPVMGLFSCRALAKAQTDLGTTQSAIDTQSVSYEQHLAQEAALITRAREKHGVDWTKPGQAPLRIEGVFNPNPDIKAVGTAGIARFVPPEEQGAERQRDLQQALDHAQTPAAGEALPGEGCATPATVKKLGADRYVSGVKTAPVRATPLATKPLALPQNFRDALNALYTPVPAKAKGEDKDEAVAGEDECFHCVSTARRCV
jgi:hypothetical protein